MGQKQLVRVLQERRPLDPTARRILVGFDQITRAALARCAYEVVSTGDSTVLHLVILVDTSPSILAHIQTICDGANALIRSMQDQTTTTVLVTIRGMHSDDPWINAVPVTELTMPALLPYKTYSGTPLFSSALGTSAFAEGKEQELLAAGVTYVMTQVTALTDAGNNMSGPVTAELVRVAVKGLKATGRYTFRGIGVGGTGPRRMRLAFFRQVFRSMGFDTDDIAAVNDSAGILNQFSAAATAAIGAAETLAITAG